MIRVILILLFFLTQTNKAFSLIEVDITRGNLDPLPIAVSPLHVDTKSENFKDLKYKFSKSVDLFCRLKKLFDLQLKIWMAAQEA